MKRKKIYNLISSILVLMAVLLMFCIAGGLDSDKLTIKNAVVLALIDFNFFGVAMVLSTKGGSYGETKE